ncbi:MAG: hypothetical protein ACOCG6_05365 [Candidatus Cloacimonadaceae bacterium]
MENSKLVINFVRLLRETFPTVIFRFEYQEEDGWYKIWHTYEKVFEDKRFNNIIGGYIKDFLLPKGFHKVYFDLDLDYIEGMKNYQSDRL